MTDRRGDSRGRRADDIHPDAVIEAAKEAARVVTAAGIVELVDEVRKLRKTFGDYGGLLEIKLRRRWRILLVAILVASAVLTGFGYTLFVIDRASNRALMAACEQRKSLENAILDVLRPSLEEPREPGEPVYRYERQQDSLRRIIAGIESPPCSEQVV